MDPSIHPRALSSVQENHVFPNKLLTGGRTYRIPPEPGLTGNKMGIE